MYNASVSGQTLRLSRICDKDVDWILPSEKFAPRSISGVWPTPFQWATAEATNHPSQSSAVNVSRDYAHCASLRTCGRSGNSHMELD